MGHADADRSLRTPVIMGGVFGFVYVMANATRLPSGAAQTLRVIAIVAFVGLFAMMRGSGRFDASRATGRFGRGYWCVVSGEVVALLAGAIVLTGPFNAGDCVIAWVSVVVGLHFIALAAVWHQPFYDALGAAIAACGVAGLAVGAFGASAAVIGAIGGVAPGFMLLGAAYRPLLRPHARAGGS